MTKPTKTADPTSTDDLDRLRDLIIGDDANRLHTLDRRVCDLESRTEDVAEVLPGAMSRVSGDPIAGPQIEQPIVDTIRGAIKRDTESFAEALFPVLGPAIRRAVADALKSLVERVNVALEHSFTIKGLRWRMEAARSGIPFGQIVLRDTMVYAVQEAFLIQRDSGLLLATVRRDETLALDEDAFSAMLTAIQAFIQDSLGMSADELLSSVELGDRTVWVVNGPEAVLACVISGTPPHELHDQMLKAIETLHARFGDQLDQAPEQLADEAGVTAVMVETLKEQAVEDAKDSSKSSYKWWWAVAAIVLLTMLWSSWNAYQTRRLEQQVAGLFETQTGYVLTSHRASSGHVYLAGLRDPLAETPESMLQSLQIDIDDVTLAFRPYQSLEEDMVLQRLHSALGSDAALSLQLSDATLVVQGELSSAQYELLEGLPGAHPVIQSVNLEQARLTAAEVALRVRRQLDAPASVTIVPQDGNIVLSGSASADWFGTAVASAEPVDGWPLDFTPLRSALAGQLDSLQSDIDGSNILFTRGYELDSAMHGELDALARQLLDAQKLAVALQTGLSIRLEGYADGVGSLNKNRAVAQNRARAIQSELGRRGVDTDNVTLEVGQWQDGTADPAQRKVLVYTKRESIN